MKVIFTSSVPSTYIVSSMTVIYIVKRIISKTKDELLEVQIVAFFGMSNEQMGIQEGFIKTFGGHLFDANHILIAYLYFLSLIPVYKFLLTILCLKLCLLKKLKLILLVLLGKVSQDRFWNRTTDQLEENQILLQMKLEY
jgi:hypothetical protein